MILDATGAELVFYALGFVPSAPRRLRQPSQPIVAADEDYHMEDAISSTSELPIADDHLEECRR